MEKFFWVGPRESDSLFNQYIEGVISYYSKKNPTEIRSKLSYGKPYNQFIEKSVNDILLQNPNAKFMFYNAKTAHSLSNNLRSHFIGMNSLRLLNMLSDKMYTRFWLANTIPTVSSILMAGSEIEVQKLKNIFKGYDTFIIQENKSSGGFGTYILNNDNAPKIQKTLHKDELYSISPYYKRSFSTNSQFVIFDDEILLLPCSVQIVLLKENRLLYHGSDFFSFQEIPSPKKDLINKYTYKIAKKLKLMGYRGIGGIDYLIDKDNVYFLEINSRFQASSIVINKALEEEKLPSIQELNLQAFAHKKCPKYQLQSFYPKYSMFKILGTDQNMYPNHIYSCLVDDKYVTDILDDGFRVCQTVEKDAYAYQVIFNTNISQINPDNQLNIYPNLLDINDSVVSNVNLLNLKIALLNQGCRITPKAKMFLEQKSHIKRAVFQSIDFTIFNTLPVNAPCGIKFSNYSPFTIEEDKQKIYLMLYNKKISNISVELEDSLMKQETSSGVKYSQLAYKSTDRLRLKHEKICYMKEVSGGCLFCNIPAKRKNFTFSDLQEVINAFVLEDSFRHILIGGASGNPETEYKEILALTKYLRKKTSKPLYLMALPPHNTEILDMYYEAGINEIAFNIEIYDEKIAQQIMPAKGMIPRQHYLEMLSYATALWGTTGNVRTAFIAGLEPIESTLAGVENVCARGIQPMISVFRPIPGTKLENWLMPSNNTLENLYYKAEAICKRYNQVLGPSCKWCRNNMLAL